MSQGRPGHLAQSQSQRHVDNLMKNLPESHQRTSTNTSNAPSKSEYDRRKWPSTYLLDHRLATKPSVQKKKLRASLSSGIETDLSVFAPEVELSKMMKALVTAKEQAEEKTKVNAVSRAHGHMVLPPPLSWTPIGTPSSRLSRTSAMLTEIITDGEIISGIVDFAHAQTLR